MNRSQIGPIMLLAVVGIILIGEVVVYGMDTRNYSSDVEWSSEEVDVNIHSSLNDTYSVMLNENTLKLERLFIYIDPDYSKNVDVAENLTDIIELDPEYDADQLMRNLELRNFKNVSVCGPSDISNILETYDPMSTGIVCMAYALDKQIYGSGPSSKLVEWVRNGGTLYWVGSVIGELCYDDQGNIVQVSDGYLLVGDARQNTNSAKADRSVGVPLSLRNTDMMLGATVDSSSQCLQLGWSDGVFSTMTFYSRGSGNVCIVGGDLERSNVNDLSQIISSGICAKTSVVAHEEGNFKGNRMISFEITITPNMSVYIYFGGMMTSYGARYDA